MTLLERLGAALKTAQKSGDAVRREALRLALAEVHNKEIENRGKGKEGALSEEEVVGVLQRELKKRTEAAALFRKGGRPELAERVHEESKVLREFVPAAPPREEIVRAVEELIAAGHTEFNSLMKEAMQRFRGRVEGSVVAEIVKETLTQASEKTSS